MTEMLTSIILSYFAIVFTVYFLPFRLGLPCQVTRDELLRNAVKYACAVPFALFLMVSSRGLPDFSSGWSLWSFELDLSYYNDVPSVFYLLMGKWFLCDLSISNRGNETEQN